MNVGMNPFIGQQVSYCQKFLFFIVLCVKTGACKENILVFKKYMVWCRGCIKHYASVNAPQPASKCPKVQLKKMLLPLLLGFPLC